MLHGTPKMAHIGWPGLVLGQGLVLVVLGCAFVAQPVGAQSESCLALTVADGYTGSLPADGQSYTILDLNADPGAGCWNQAMAPGGVVTLDEDASSPYVRVSSDCHFERCDPGEFPVEIAVSAQGLAPADLLPQEVTVTVAAEYCPPGTEKSVGYCKDPATEEEWKAPKHTATAIVTLTAPTDHQVVEGDLRISLKDEAAREGIIADGKSQAVLQVDIVENAACWGAPVDRAGNFTLTASTTLGSISPTTMSFVEFPAELTLKAGTRTGDAKVEVELSYCPPDSVGVAGVCSDPNAEWTWNSCSATITIPFVEPPSASESQPAVPSDQEATGGEAETREEESETSKSEAPEPGLDELEEMAWRLRLDALVRDLSEFLAGEGVTGPNAARAAAGGVAVTTLIAIWLITNAADVDVKSLLRAVQEWLRGDGKAQPEVAQEDVALPGEPPRELPEGDRIGKGREPSAVLPREDVTQLPAFLEKQKPAEEGPIDLGAKAWKDAVNEEIDPANAPEHIRLPNEVNETLARANRRSLEGGRVREVGGVFGEKADGTCTTISESEGTQIEVQGVEYPPAAHDPRPIGGYHTHVWTPEGQDKDIAPSDGDFGNFLHHRKQVEAIQAGDKQWLMVITKETPFGQEVPQGEITREFDRVYQAARGEGCTHAQAVGRAAVDAANRYKVKLYHGQNGDLRLVNP